MSIERRRHGREFEHLARAKAELPMRADEQEQLQERIVALVQFMEITRVPDVVLTELRGITLGGEVPMDLRSRIGTGYTDLFAQATDETASIDKAGLSFQLGGGGERGTMGVRIESSTTPAPRPADKLFFVRRNLEQVGVEVTCEDVLRVLDMLTGPEVPDMSHLVDPRARNTFIDVVRGVTDALGAASGARASRKNIYRSQCIMMSDSGDGFGRGTRLEVTHGPDATDFVLHSMTKLPVRNGHVTEVFRYSFGYRRQAKGEVHVVTSHPTLEHISDNLPASYLQAMLSNTDHRYSAPETAYSALAELGADVKY